MANLMGWLESGAVARESPADVGVRDLPVAGRLVVLDWWQRISGVAALAGWEGDLDRDPGP
jgi:hypothetical protein